MAMPDLAPQNDFLLSIPAELGVRIEQRARAQHKDIAQLLDRALELEQMIDDAPQLTQEEQEAFNTTAAHFLPAHVVDATTYDAWVREQVMQALDDDRPGIPNSIVESDFSQRRAELLRRAG